MRVTILTMGGTIASDENGKIVGLPWERGRVPVPAAGDEVVETTFREVAALSSPDIEMEDVLRLRNAIVEELESEDCDGILVTHGTDTLEETAFAVAASLDTRKPVGFTGAMRAPNEPGSDAAVNFGDALLALSAARRLARPPVMVALGGVIHDATRATKGHTSSPAAFTSGHAGPIGFVHEGEARFLNRVMWPDLTPFKSPGHLSGELGGVDLFTATAGGDPSVLSKLALTDSMGVVISGTGGGHLPKSHMASLRVCVEAGMVVAITTRCAEGLSLRGGELGGGVDAASQGAVYSPFNALKTRMLLSVGSMVLGNRSGLTEAIRGLWSDQTGSGGHA